ncbi:hypothetical protein [Microbacterium sp. P26]|nr:hypothetical protein [Microbacterium sp. P26]
MSKPPGVRGSGRARVGGGPFDKLRDRTRVGALLNAGLAVIWR